MEEHAVTDLPTPKIHGLFRSGTNLARLMIGEWFDVRPTFDRGGFAPRRAWCRDARDLDWFAPEQRDPGLLPRTGYAVPPPRAGSS